MEKNKIKLKYLLKGNTEYQTMFLSLEDYFDNLHPDDEVYSIDSLSKYNYPWTYLDVDTKDILCLCLHIQIHDDSLEEKYTFWNLGRSYLLERIHKRKGRIRENLLVSLNEMLKDGLNRNEVLRIKRHKDFENFLVPISDTIEIGEADDGVNKELIIVENDYFKGKDY